ncbi:D-alanyl-D-alanine carboxypeptidase (penicillin-binding protein 5/6) [Rhizobium sp. RU33A]|uniref:D-alanyl-D-alanine carboxypeptidase n=1 Tax=Rhizobium sp. RU33A TaxID=1907413 RepID=UPI000954A574|nr:D-alanyl-D-alanine carboxypeptidase [Rhizobium sp. RU33A]SIQ06578.1 D-alanyl-D-alanine carboxypeptidase (penicillin-binding protein 5/6) [Rhizobium sp. RU33A]
MSKLLIAFSFCVAILTLSTTAHAGSAQLLLDARTGEVLASENADVLNHPASLTKMMSVYMVFDAIKAGKLSWDSPVPFSKHAASRPPTKLFVKAGDSITVREAVLAMIIRSANDASAAIGEKIGGSEEGFAALMTRKARSLGMMNTTFFNASGLPHAQQFTTARDMSTLGVALMRDFPKEYELFATKSFKFRGKTINGHNNLMYRYKGMDGIKTGYTNASGFNLVSAVEHDGRRVIGVVLGGRTAASRDKIMERLIDANIKKASTGQQLLVSRSTGVQMDLARLGDEVPVPASRQSALAAVQGLAGATGTATPGTASAYAPSSQAGTADLVATPASRFAAVDPQQTASTPSTSFERRWQVQIAAATSAQAAMDLLSQARQKVGGPLQGLDTYTEMVSRNGITFYRARFTGFETKEAARAACDKLVRQRYDCVLMPARG